MVNARILYVVVALVVIVVIASLLFLAPKTTPGQQTSPANATSTSYSNTTTTPMRSGISFVKTTTTSKTLNKELICSQEVISATISLRAIRDQRTQELRFIIEVYVDKKVNDTVIVKSIRIDEDKYRSIVRINPDLIDDLTREVNAEAPVEVTGWWFTVPPELETQYSTGTSHKVKIVYEYMGVECSRVFEVVTG